MCWLHQIFGGVVTEIVHFVWIDKCTIVEEENAKHKQLSELKTLIRQKYPIAVAENSIERALKLSQNKLRRPKEKRTEEIIPFLSTQP